MKIKLDRILRKDITFMVYSQFTKENLKFKQIC